MVAVSSFMGVSVAVYALGEIDEARIRRYFFPLYLLLMFGVNGAFLPVIYSILRLVRSHAYCFLHPNVDGGERCELEGGLKYVCLI